MRKKIMCLGLAIVLLVSFLTCFHLSEDKRLGAFYTLREAYENGWLTENDLKIVAYYHNNKVDYFRRLNYVDAVTIKKSRVKSAQKYRESDVSMNDINIEKYYGTYNSCIVVSVFDGTYWTSIRPVYGFTVGEVTFYVDGVQDYAQMLVWKR